MSLFQLVYISKAVKLFSEAELIALHEKGKERNQRRKVTGLLLCSGGNFLQLMEGPQHIVNDLFAVIYRDRRHTDIKRLLSESTEQRLFADYALGFWGLEQAADVDRSRFERIVQALHQPGQYASGGKKALALFHEFRTQLSAERAAA